MRVIRPFDSIQATDVADAGGKGANLGELTQAGLPVPPGFVIATDGYATFVEQTGISEPIAAAAEAVTGNDHHAAEQAAKEIAELFGAAAIPDSMAAQITAAYDELAPESTAVAVRSSATAEDLADASFAGQQDTYLNIRGHDQLLHAVRDCWASLWTARAIAYRRNRDIDPRSVRLAVVVQQLIDADAAGVLFTANPTNGRRDETVISAAWGLGEAVVGGLVTTDNLALSRTDDRWSITDRDIADKEVQTVRTDTGTEEVPVADELRRRAVLTDADAIALAELGRRVSDHYGRPMDLEWALADRRPWLVQARPITALAEPVGDAPTDWTVPDRRMYFRASIVEMMPEPLTPLFGDLIEPAVIESLGKLFQEYLGVDQHGLLVFPTINGYAYYGYSWAALGKMTARSPRAMVSMFRGGKTGAEAMWRTSFHPEYREVVDSWQSRDATASSARELLQGVEELLLAGCRYYTGVQAVLPVAASTETIFARMYRPFRRRTDPPATTFVLGLESSPMRAERELYALGRWCREHPALLKAIDDRPSDQPAIELVRGAAPDGVDHDVWQQWRQRIGSYLDTFGHTITDLDFSNPVAADDPAAVLETIKFYATDDRPQAESDPGARQHRLATEREQATQALLGRIGPARRAIGPVLAKAQHFGGLREDALADVGLGWPRIRSLLGELGDRLVSAGLITDPQDVYWLQAEELRAATAALDDDGSLPLGSGGMDPGTMDPGTMDPDAMADRVADRKMTWRGRRTVRPPQLLPLDSRANKLLSRMMPSVESVDDGPELKGLGASGGTVTGRACLITDHSDFGRMEPGMIIVAKITTPAYTPLFAMAGGVVTDVGGPLSHSSIVAREYGIPAVLGTSVATQRIKHGDLITVDGTAGVVHLAESDPADPDPADPELGKSSSGTEATAGGVDG